MRIGINGFGRIGRQAFRIAWDREELNVIHVNDFTNAAVLAHLLKYDSVYGVWDHEVQAGEGILIVDDEEVIVTSEREPKEIPWGQERVDVVLESTGAFRKREQAQGHIDAGARKVLISAPGRSQLDGTFVLGVNDQLYEKENQHIISIGSCTTNCLAPIAHVLHEEFKIVHGLMTTVHAYTSSQSVVDLASKDLRRSRAAAINIIPTSTGAAATIGLVMPDLDGKLDGLALRVPVAAGSILDLTCEVERPASVEQVVEAMHKWADGPMQGILQVAPAPIVSSDVVGNSHSALFSSEDTFVADGRLVKVMAWYDNEWGFSNRLVDMIKRMI